MTIPANIIAPMMDVEAVNVLLTPQDPSGHGAGQGSPFVPITVNINVKSTGSTLNVGTAHALQYSLNSGGSWTDIVGWSSGATVNTSLTLTLSIGTYPLWVRAMDQLGTISAIAKTTIISNSLSVSWGPLGVQDGDVSTLQINWAFPGYQIIYFATRYPSGEQAVPPGSELGFLDAYGFGTFHTTADWTVFGASEDTSDSANVYAYSPPYWPTTSGNLIGSQFNFFNTNPH